LAHSVDGMASKASHKTEMCCSYWELIRDDDGHCAVSDSRPSWLADNSI